MKRFTPLVLTLLMAFACIETSAQERQITGKVTSSADTASLPGVIVKPKNFPGGTVTDMDGNYSITVPGEAKTLVFSMMGMATKEVEIGSSNTINISLSQDLLKLSEVVVTALGISREKKSLGYATQEISGDELTNVKSGNFVNQISGKVSGVQVKNNNNMGGSTNIIIRGNSSILGNNQALFIIDGIPLNNSTNNSNYQNRGGAGYDYGSPISDINPQDIESINVLKGAAATALYGARAANGVIIITTKKGKAMPSGQRRYGITLNSSLNMGIVDKSTFPTYQEEYGAGYGPYYGGGPGGHFLLEDFKGDGTADDLVVPYTEDASFGAKFDPNLMIYQWDAFVPGHKNFHKATPWVSAGENGPISFFNRAMNYTNGIIVDGGTDKGVFRVSYANTNQSGILPNSTAKRNNFGVNSGFDLNDKFRVDVNANYVKNESVGRNSTGYGNNELTCFRQWWQTNVSLVDQKEIYEQTGANYTWNPGSSAINSLPIYWDNFYFQRNKSFTSDDRDRFFGNVALTYKLNEMISLITRIGADQFSTIQEERLAVGSVSKPFGVGLANSSSGYSRLNQTFREVNFDVMTNFKKDINENFNVTGLLGTNIRRSTNNTVFASTNGGLVISDLYALSNSKSTPNPPVEQSETIGVNGFFASASLGYKRFLYLDLTARQDYSSTLPVDNNSFFYPGASVSFLFSEKLQNLTWMDFGKVRLNYAQVGNDAPFASIKDVYAKPIAFGNTPLFSLPDTKNNETLEAEISTSIEAGLEMIFFKRRLGFDLAVYQATTDKQIVPVSVSTATGYVSKFVNAGVVENKGIELTISGTPVMTKNFNWTINFNYAANRNKVTELYEGVDNLQIASFQGGVTLNATLNEPYGTLKGTDYVYLNGEKVVGADGYYKRSTTTTNVLGNINPDFTAGVSNSFSYKNWSFSFLIDMQKGGDIWALDLSYGMGTGLYPETVGNNDLGNPVRNTIANGGGVVLKGVTENGETNTKRAPGDNYLLNGWARNPNAAFIYDASYIKLRETAITYKLPLKRDAFFTGASISLVGSNLWIIHKNLPYSDPEAGLSAGNVQGYQSGTLPSTRNFGLNVTLQF